MTDNEGWGFLPGLSRKWHYFVDGRSLCGSYGFYKGTLEPGPDDSSNNCTVCKRKKKSRDLKK